MLTADLVGPLRETGDDELVARAVGGDVAAFDELYRRYADALDRYCSSVLDDAHEGQDIAQDAFVRAWEHLPRLGGDRRFYPWIRTIAYHLCMDAIRRRRRTRPVAEPDRAPVAGGGAGAADAADRTHDAEVSAAIDAELADRARRAVSRLPVRHRRVIDLRDIRGWTFDRIAASEGLNEAATRALLMRARRALRREYAELARGEAALAGLSLGGWVLRRLHSARARLAAAAEGPVSAVMGNGVAACVVSNVAIAASVAAMPAAAPADRVPPAAPAVSIAAVSPAVPLAGGAGDTAPAPAPDADGPARPTATAGVAARHDLRLVAPAAARPGAIAPPEGSGPVLTIAPGTPLVLLPQGLAGYLAPTSAGVVTAARAD